MKPARTVALRRPKGTRASSRVALTITMHPRELAALEQRAAAASMSLRAYVAALLESDREDVPGAGGKRNPKINWLEDKPMGELLARRCGEPIKTMVGNPVEFVDTGATCTLAVGHDGPHDPTWLRPGGV